MSRNRLASSLSAALLLAMSAPAAATVVAALPDVTIVTPPDVSLDQTESDIEIKGFDEQQCIVLNFDLMTDQGRILEQTPLSWHLFHTDPVTMALLQGKARFDADIIGVISDPAELDASDLPCGLPGVIYPVPGTEPDRGLEAFQPNDGYRVSTSRRVIAMRVDVPSFTDQIRVITECAD